jgi:hypothetical protein
MIILNESSLKRILKTYFQYYEHSRTHLSLQKGAPASRAVQLPELGTRPDKTREADDIGHIPFLLQRIIRRPPKKQRDSNMVETSATSTFGV